MNSNHRSHWKELTLAILAVGLCLAFALSHSFSSMAIYDDESYIMMTIQTFLDGDRLYAETYTQYGPAYYMIQQPIHGWLQVPLTHDIVRVKTVCTWVLIGILCGVIATKLTQRRLVGVAAMFLSVMHLQKLGLEPAHPQEVVALLSVIGVLLMSRKSRWALFFAGVVAAVAGLSKLNAGAVLAAAMLFAASLSNPGVRRMDWLYPLFGSLISIGLSAGVFMTIAKASSESGDWFTVLWPLVIAVSAVLACLVAWQGREVHQVGSSLASPAKRSFLQPFVCVALGGVIGSMFVLGWSFAHGNTVGEVLHGVIFQHRFMAQSFYHPVQVDQAGLVFAIVSCGLLAMRCLRFAHAFIEKKSIDRALVVVAPVALLLAVVQIGMDMLQPLQHGLNPRGAANFLATAGPAIMPVLLLKHRSQLRLAIVMVGCLSPILAFPVPGTQVSLGTLPILVGLVVASFDAMSQIGASENSPTLFARRVVVGLTLLMIATTSVFAHRWANNDALDQPGCRWVRLETNRVAKERAIAECIRSTDSAWLAFDSHNHNRFFFWTGKRPLTSTSPTFWPAMLTDEQKESIEAAANNADSICVVKLNDKRILLSKYAPSIERAFFESWIPISGAGDWQVGLKSKQSSFKLQ